MYKYLILIFSVVLVVSCTTSSSSGNASLAGTISLLNSDDHSGVTVVLYNLAYLDTTLVRINQEYPHIGVIITQETEFDHRLQTPVKFTQTDLAGNFKLEGIRPGKYNLALLKEGYSLKYVYNIHLSEGSNTLSTPNSKSTSVSHCKELVDEAIFNSKLDNSSVVKNALNSSSVSSVANMFYLYPSVLIPPVVSIPITFQTGVQYNFPQNTIITAPVTIEPGTILAVGVNRKIDFHSTISTPETGIRWWLTSAHSINALPDLLENSKLDNVLFDRINILGTSQITLQNGKVSFLKDGLNISPNNSIYTNIRAQHGFSHANVNSDNHTFSNVLVTDFSQRAHMFSGSSVIEKNIFYNNVENILLSENEAIVQNNYFHSNYVAVRPFYGSINIKNNNFENNDYSISTVASNPLIEYNNFYGSKTYCIQTHKHYIHAFYDYSNPVIKNNNLLGNNIMISLIARANMFSGFSYLASGGLGVRNNIDAISNFWKNTPVNDLIIDNTTYPNINNPQDSNFCPYLILYDPKRNAKVPNAGILRIF